ncbi:hypothetical protein ACHAWF_005761 [Thalassiosira exigua]
MGPIQPGNQQAKKRKSPRAKWRPPEAFKAMDRQCR